MIRINLLEVRPRSSERLDSILSSGRSSTFISRREALVGVMFLALTGGILGVLAMRFGPGGAEPADVEAASTVAPPPTAPQAVIPEPPAPAPIMEQPPVEQPPIEEPAAAESAPPPRTQEAVAPPEAASGAGHVLTNVRATPLADWVDVFLEVPNSAEINSFRMENPPRVVFDLADSALAVVDAQRNQALDSPLVKRLRMAQFSLEPPVVRLVLEVGDGPVSTTLSRSAAGVSIRVTAER
jgi:hypothetical protein